MPNPKMVKILIIAFLASISFAEAIDFPLVFEDNFESGSERWRPFDPSGWKIVASRGGHHFSQFKKDSSYVPPHRSPFNIAISTGPEVTDFVLDASVLSTHKDYDHRDACVIFGYQDASHFYYVHFGKKADDHANQIFIVNDAARKKISTESTTGTPWTNAWHKLRIRRSTETGEIEVFFDDFSKPVMRACDKTFREGRIGIGSFDDTTDWDDIKLHGIVKSSQR